MEDGARSQELELRKLVLECSDKILESLLVLTSCPGQAQMSDAFVTKINLLYLDMDSCDYIGEFQNALLVSGHPHFGLPLILFILF